MMSKQILRDEEPEPECGMLWTSDRPNVTIIFALIIFLASLKHGVGMNAINGSPQDLQISDQHSIRSSSESISAKLLHIQHLVTSLFSDWNFGESQVEGSMERTFGRIRMIRKMMLPLTFMGGFLTAVILSIKFTGLINMVLISKVLMLQMALVLGKIIYGAKEFFNKFSYPQPYYIPVAHREHSHGYSHSKDDDLYPEPSNLYGQRFPSPLSLRFGLQHQPQFNQPINYPINRRQNFQPQLNFGQPQSSPFEGISMQTPHQIQTSQSQQFSQPYYQDRSQIYDTLESRLTTENHSGEALSAVKPQNSLSPYEMTQLLSDAIAQMSTQTTPRSNNFYQG